MSLIKSQKRAKKKNLLSRNQRAVKRLQSSQVSLWNLISVEKSEAPKDLGPEPKKPASNYILFNTEYVAKVKAEDSELSHADAFKAAGAKW